MNEEILKKINSLEIINKMLGLIIEAFVTFYGESERKRITKAFKNMQIICYSKPEDMDLIIENSEIQKLEDITSNILDKININNLDKQTLKKILFDDVTEYDCISTLDSYIDYLNGNKDRKLETINLLKKFYPEVNKENLDELISSKAFKEIDNIIPLYNEMIEEYKKFILSTKDYKKYLKKCYKVKTMLSKKYLKKLLSNLKLILPKEYYQKIESDYNLIIDSYNNNSDRDSENIYLNRDLSPTTFELFSEKCDKILEKDEDYRKEFIQNERILYFKKMGLNLGDEYLAYEASEETKKIIPPKEILELLIEKREELYLQMKNEYYQSLPEYQINREKINRLELFDKDDGYDVYAYENNSTIIVPNIKQVNNEYIMYPLVLIYLAEDGGYLDSFIIHELNHVIETSLLSFDGKKYQIACGWEIFSDVIATEPDLTKYLILEEEEKREYELFSEVINELISEDITKILFDLGYYIFNNKDNALYIGGTNYECAKFLVEEFYKTYKKEIIESRKNGNIEIIYDTVGKENFEELNKLFHLFYEHFPDASFLDTKDDLEENIDNEKTKIYYELCKERDKILSNMKKYKNSKKRTLSV